MRLQRELQLVNSVYIATLSVVELTATEKESLGRHAAPVVDCGGNFGAGETAFTLPADNRQFPAQFPVTKRWAYSEENGAAAALWLTELEARVVAAITTVLGLPVGPVGVNQTTYNL